MDLEKTQPATPAPNPDSEKTQPATPAPNPVLEKLPAPPDRNRTAEPTPPPSDPGTAAAAATTMVETPPAPTPAPTPAAPTPAPVSNMLSQLVGKIKDSFKISVVEAPATPAAASSPMNPAPVTPAAPAPQPAATAIAAALATAPPAPTSSAWAKTPFYKKPAFIGLVCVILGAVIGASVIFAVIKSSETPTVCPSCDCEKTSAATVEDLSPVTAFLNLEPQNQNIVLSPLAIQYGLATLSTGASGTTKSQIDQILSSSKFANYSSLPDNLSIANAFVASTTYRDMLLPSFTSTVTKKYSTEILYDELKNTASLDTWFKNKTFGLIDTIDVAVDASMESALITSLALQADWQNAFNPTATTLGTFFSTGSEATVPFMNGIFNSADITYVKNNSLTALSLPLTTATSGPNLDFVILMPANNFSNYVKNLDAAQIDSALSGATPASSASGGLYISLPKFKIDYAMNFKNDLELLGVTDAFSADSATFPSITSLPEGIHLGAAVHKNSLFVSEYGLNSTADLGEGSENIPSTDSALAVTIDHPFLFLIRDRDNGLIWLIGTVYAPSI